MILFVFEINDWVQEIETYGAGEHPHLTVLDGVSYSYIIWRFYTLSMGDPVTCFKCYGAEHFPYNLLCLINHLFPKIPSSSPPAELYNNAWCSFHIATFQYHYRLGKMEKMNSLLCNGMQTLEEEHYEEKVLVLYFASLVLCTDTAILY